MKRLVPAVFAVLALVVPAGCTGEGEIFNVPLTSDREPSGAGIVSAGKTTAQLPSEPAADEPRPELETPKLVCENASKALLQEMAVVANAQKSWFVKGKAVKIDDDWTAVAIESVVPPESGFDPDYNGGTRTFITGSSGSVESNSGLGPRDITIRWGGMAIAKASECLGQ
ncbi:MAG: hypothetical protein LBI99_05145 [Propionibacteriaceae bacterium]|nr:hypothetical protein [Propionibacteriaceae bacterium]